MLEMFLFSIEKGKEKYLVDNKNKYDFVKEAIPDAHEFLQAVYDAQNKISKILTPDMYLGAELDLGGDLLPYNLIIPNCKKPDKYHNYLCYWGASTAILNWFVKNVQCGVNDDKWHIVSSEDLKLLKSTCETVIANSELPCSGPLDDESYYTQLIKNPVVAKELLPITDGYCQEKYDGRYLMRLKYTVEKLEKILEETDFDKVTVFFNSWR